MGFIRNGVQYFYFTNQMGDVISITDAQGNELVEYEYDEWGKLILTRADNQSNESIANINPIRYRGYYYDTETGYYYLQSRYYDPGLGRFISADDFSYIDASEKFSINAYAYCANNPVNFSDSTGYDFTWDTLLGIIRDCLIIDFIFPQFRYKPKITLPKVSKPKVNTTKINLKSNASKWVSEAGKVIGVVITEIFVCLELQFIAEKLKVNFSFNDLYEYSLKKVDLLRKAFDSKIITEEIKQTNIIVKISEWVSRFASIFDGKLPTEVSAVSAFLPYFTNVINDYSGRYISPIGSAFMALFDLFINGIVDVAELVMSKFVSPVVGVLFGASAEKLYNLEEVRKKAEFWAYNWYFLLFVDWRNI